MKSADTDAADTVAPALSWKRRRAYAPVHTPCSAVIIGAQQGVVAGHGPTAAIPPPNTWAQRGT